MKNKTKRRPGPVSARTELEQQGPPPPPAPAPCTCDLEDLIRLLAEMLKGTTTPDHPLRKRATFVLAKASGDDQYPDEREMREVLDALHRLPVAEQKRILGGWTSAAWRWIDRRTHGEPTADQSLFPCLDLAVGERLWSCLDATYFINAADQVRVQIRVGTTKAEALAALQEAIDHLDAKWDALAAGETDEARAMREVEGRPA